MRSSTARHAARWTARLGVATLFAGSIAAATITQASATKGLELTSTSATGFPGILAAGSSGTLYVLSTEKGAKLHCTGSCLKTWHPLEVPSATKSVKEASKVDGKVGFVKRTSKEKQVTFNSYPVYTYSGDSSATDVKGEALTESGGGRWYLVHASAKSSGATPFVAELQTANVTGYTDILEDGLTSYSLYLLTDEKGGTIHCTGSCLSAWFPLLVPDGTKAIALGAGVDGAIGFVSRGSGKEQVTFNTYPVYTFFEDTGPGQTNGEGSKSDGGEWELLSAKATTASATPIPPS